MAGPKGDVDGKKLESARKACGNLTQLELAAKAGCSDRAIRNVETTHKCSWEMLENIVQALNYFNELRHCGLPTFRLADFRSDSGSLTNRTVSPVVALSLSEDEPADLPVLQLSPTCQNFPSANILTVPQPIPHTQSSTADAPVELTGAANVASIEEESTPTSSECSPSESLADTDPHTSLNNKRDPLSHELSRSDDFGSSRLRFSPSGLMATATMATLVIAGGLMRGPRLLGHGQQAQSPGPTDVNPTPARSVSPQNRGSIFVAMEQLDLYDSTALLHGGVFEGLLAAADVLNAPLSANSAWIKHIAAKNGITVAHRYSATRQSNHTPSHALPRAFTPRTVRINYEYPALIAILVSAPFVEGAEKPPSHYYHAIIDTRMPRSEVALILEGIPQEESGDRISVAAISFPFELETPSDSYLAVELLP